MMSRPWVTQGGNTCRQCLSDAIIALVHSRRKNVKSPGVSKYDYDGWHAGELVAPFNHYILKLEILTADFSAEYLDEFDESANLEFNRQEIQDEIYDRFKEWLDREWPVKVEKPGLFERIKRFFRSNK
jgi:hypothetical protein